MKILFLIFSCLVAVFGCAQNQYKWVAPPTNSSIPFSTTSPLLVNSLPETIVDAVTVLSGSNEKGIYEATGDIVVIDGKTYLYSASTLKIGPNLIIPVLPDKVDYHLDGVAISGSYKFKNVGTSLVGKVNFKVPLKLILNFNASEYILSGPTGCTLKRTIPSPRGGKELLLVEGNAYLLK